MPLQLYKVYREKEKTWWDKHTCRDLSGKTVNDIQQPNNWGQNGDQIDFHAGPPG